MRRISIYFQRLGLDCFPVYDILGSYAYDYYNEPVIMNLRKGPLERLTNTNGGFNCFFPHEKMKISFKSYIFLNQWDLFSEICFFREIDKIVRVAL